MQELPSPLPRTSGFRPRYHESLQRICCTSVREEPVLAEFLKAHGDYALALRYVQLRLSLWMNRQVASPEFVPPPQLEELINDVLLLHQWRPIPARNMELPGLPGDQPGYVQPAPKKPAPQSSSGQAANPPIGDNGRSMHVTNTTYHQDMKEYKDGGLSLCDVREKAIAANKPIPLNDKGTEVCLSYHVTGFCFANCNRKEDH